jgi:hypothetical protein
MDDAEVRAALDHYLKPYLRADEGFVKP